MARGGEGNGAVVEFGRLLDAAGAITVLTGAGISTESGIPDFRSPGGVWSRMTPITYGEFVASEAARLEDWRRRFRMNASFAEASPNAGHRGLTLLAARSTFVGLITQNIDGLHQRAGFPPDRLIEIHGNATHGRCLGCGAAMTLPEVRSRIERTGASPRCPCGDIVKAAIVSFGETLPGAPLRQATEWAARSDLFVVIGSSLVVRPAASLPRIAAQAGAAVVIVNREETPLDPAADLVVREAIGEVFSTLFPQLVQ